MEWKLLKKQHTPFWWEYIEEFIDGDIKFNNNVWCKLSKKGHFIGKLILKISFNTNIFNNESFNSSNQFNYIETLKQNLNEEKNNLTNLNLFFELIHEGIKNIINIMAYDSIILNDVLNELNVILWGNNLLFYNTIKIDQIYNQYLINVDIYYQIITNMKFINSIW